LLHEEKLHIVAITYIIPKRQQYIEMAELSMSSCNTMSMNYAPRRGVAIYVKHKQLNMKYSQSAIYVKNEVKSKCYLR
jgi:hypothetical protein